MDLKRQRGWRCAPSASAGAIARGADARSSCPPNASGRRSLALSPASTAAASKCWSTTSGARRSSKAGLPSGTRRSGTTTSTPGFRARAGLLRLWGPPGEEAASSAARPERCAGIGEPQWSFAGPSRQPVSGAASRHTNSATLTRSRWPGGRAVDRDSTPTRSQQPRHHRDLPPGIDNAEIIETVHARRAPMISVSTSLRL